MNAPRLSVVPKPDDKSLIEALRDSPAGQKALAQREATAVERRTALAAEIERLDKAAAGELPALQADVAAALSELNAAGRSTRQKFENRARAEAASAGILARDRLDTAKHRSVAASFAYSTKRDAIEHQLRETASPALKLFKSEMLTVLLAARHSQPTVRSNLVKNRVTGKTSEAIASNAPSIRARMKAARDAMDEADAMALEPDQRDVELRLEKLRQSLPAIDTSVELSK